MCPPVSVRHGARGMSCLYGAWLYQLVHGEQMEMCFACFKAAFLLNKFYLEMGDWEEEEEEEEEKMEVMEDLSESSESESDSGQESGSEEDAWWGLGPHSVTHSVSNYGGSGVLVPTPLWAQGVLYFYVPTEPLPQEVVPLDLGLEAVEWTQALPWRFDGLFPCSHQLIPPLSWWDVIDMMPSPGQPVLLELRSSWPLDQAAQSWLQNQKFVLLLNSVHFMCHLMSMHVRWAVRTQVQHWQVLLNPGEMWVAHFKRLVGQHRLYHQNQCLWRLSILKASELGMELVPAACYLRKKGFWLGSFLPWQSSMPETWSWDSGERMLITEATVCSIDHHCVQFFHH